MTYSNFKMEDEAFVDELASLLKVPPKDEIIQYAKTFQNERDLDTYLRDILATEYNANLSAVKRCLALWKPAILPGLTYEVSKEDPFSFKKNKSGVSNKISNGSLENQVKMKKKDVPKMIITEKTSAVPYKEQDLPEQGLLREQNYNVRKDVSHDVRKREINTKAKKKSPKFVSLYTSEGKSRAEEIMVVPGRHGCECAGQKHKLISNCLECGRIVCEQEGSGPCHFCGNLVCTGEEQEILARNSRASEKLYEKLMTKSLEKRQADLDQAKALRDKLVEFDRTSARRTKVIDDQADYYSADSKWLSKSQREKAKKKEQELANAKHRSRLDRRYVLDFAGREVREDSVRNSYFPPDGEDAEMQDIYHHNQPDESKAVNNTDPRLKTSAPVFTGAGKVSSSADKEQPIVKKNIRSSLRIQDDEIQKISDQGLCLSMHQPWASLLVMGIKTVEGRSWYTAHRGRLWIASTAKAPDRDQIKMVEEQYKSLYGHYVEFPENYPSGALLGCVDVTDCVSQEEYRKMDGDTTESGSEFVFICENPIELLIKVPVKGKHKIWKLDTQVHKLAKSTIMNQ